MQLLTITFLPFLCFVDIDVIGDHEVMVNNYINIKKTKEV
jgi:hypothetical protein